MNECGHEGPAAGRPLGAGLLRIVLAAAVALFLIWAPTPPATVAYLAVGLAVGLALVFGAILIAGRPRPAREPLARVVADSLVVGLLTAGTGGGESPFFPLCLLAALGIVRVRSLSRVFVAGAAVLAAFLVSAAVSGGIGPLVSTPTVLKAAFVLLFCAVAGFVGPEIAGLAARNRRLSAELAAGRGRAAKVEGLVAGFGPALGNSSLEGVLRWTVEAAHAAGGGTYAHVGALRGTDHRTVLDGDPDACPSWWHPSIQRLVQQSCRDGEAARSGDEIHGIRGFLAVPVGPAEGERWGAVIVGGGEFGADEKHVLALISAAATSALESVEDAPGGRDPATGLPNTASLDRILRRELSRGRPLTVLIADVGGVRDPDLLRRIGDKLERQRAFRCGEGALALILNGADEARARRAALAVRQIVSEETAGRSAATVGFAPSGPGEEDPDALVDAAFRALTRAEKSPDGVSGETVAEAGGPAGGPAESMVGLLETKDPDIREHLEGVRRLALRIGREMALPEEQMEALSLGSLLHDIGKVGIPNRVLHKPGPLTVEEYETMKRHPVLGTEIVATLEGLAPALPMVRHHHERFDGGGYPDGLRGEEIPPLARIVSVADAFDAMTRNRPYGYGLPPEAALQEVWENSGTQFDPRVVEVLTRLSEELGHDDRRADSAG